MKIAIVIRPIRMRLTEKEGYKLIGKVEKGPAILLDRVVSIPFTSDQLDAIGNWNPEGFSILDLETIPESLVLKKIEK